MAKRTTENWEGRSIHSYGPKFRIDVANPETGANGPDVYKIYAVTDNKDVNLCSLTEGGTYQLHNDKSLEIVAGMTNPEGAVDIVITGMKGDILITAMKDGQILVDQNGDMIIENYRRFIPNINDTSTWLAIMYVLFGISLILVIDYYGRSRKIK